MVHVGKLNEDQLAPDQFCFWLQGFFELTDSNELSEKQIKIIKEHLELVFKKVTKTNLTTTTTFPVSLPNGLDDPYWKETTGVKLFPNRPMTIC